MLALGAASVQPSTSQTLSRDRAAPRARGLGGSGERVGRFCRGGGARGAEATGQPLRSHQGLATLRQGSGSFPAGGLPVCHSGQEAASSITVWLSQSRTSGHSSAHQHLWEVHAAAAQCKGRHRPNRHWGPACGLAAAQAPSVQQQCSRLPQPLLAQPSGEDPTDTSLSCSHW